jgi:hypothetical protein
LLLSEILSLLSEILLLLSEILLLLSEILLLLSEILLLLSEILLLLSEILSLLSEILLLLSEKKGYRAKKKFMGGQSPPKARGIEAEPPAMRQRRKRVMERIARRERAKPAKRLAQSNNYLL